MNKFLKMKKIFTLILIVICSVAGFYFASAVQGFIKTSGNISFEEDINAKASENYYATTLTRSNGVYLIEDENDFLEMRDLVNSGAENSEGVPYSTCKYRLTNDITVWTDPLDDDYSWEPIGINKWVSGPIWGGGYTGSYVAQPFTGQFDGDGFTIYTTSTSKIGVNGAAETLIRRYGLFGIVRQTGSEPVIKDLHVQYQSFEMPPASTGGSSLVDAYVGGLVSKLTGNGPNINTIENCTVSYLNDISVGGSGLDDVYFGGLVADAYNARIQNCLVIAPSNETVGAGVVFGSEDVYVGGLVAYAEDTVITSSIFQGDNTKFNITKGSIAGNEYVGPIVAATNNNYVYNCVVAGYNGFTLNGEANEGGVNTNYSYTTSLNISKSALSNITTFYGKNWTSSIETAGLGTITNLNSMPPESWASDSTADWVVVNNEGTLNQGYPIQQCFIKPTKIIVRNLMSSTNYRPSTGSTFDSVMLKGYSWGAFINNLNWASDSYGYSFQGLGTSSSGGVVYNSSSGSWNGNTSSWSIEGDSYILYAKWEAEEWEITFNVEFNNRTEKVVSYSGTGNMLTSDTRVHINQLNYAANEVLQENGYYSQKVGGWKCTSSSSGINTNYEYTEQTGWSGISVFWGTNTFTAILVNNALKIITHDIYGNVLATVDGLKGTVLYDDVRLTNGSLSNNNPAYTFHGWTNRSNGGAPVGATKAGGYRYADKYSGSYIAGTLIDTPLRITQINADESFGEIHLYPVYSWTTYTISYLDPFLITPGGDNGEYVYYQVVKTETYQYNDPLTFETFTASDDTAFNYFRIYCEDERYQYLNSLVKSGIGYGIPDSTTQSDLYYNVYYVTEELYCYGDVYVLPQRVNTTYDSTINFYIPTLQPAVGTGGGYELNYANVYSYKWNAGHVQSTVQLTGDLAHNSDRFSMDYFTSRGWTTTQLSISSATNSVTTINSVTRPTSGASYSVNLYLSIASWTEFNVTYQDENGAIIPIENQEAMTTYTIVSSYNPNFSTRYYQQLFPAYAASAPSNLTLTVGNTGDSGSWGNGRSYYVVKDGSYYVSMELGVFCMYGDITVTIPGGDRIYTVTITYDTNKVDMNSNILSILNSTNAPGSWSYSTSSNVATIVYKYKDYYESYNSIYDFQWAWLDPEQIFEEYKGYSFTGFQWSTVGGSAEGEVRYSNGSFNNVGLISSYLGDIKVEALFESKTYTLEYYVQYHSQNYRINENTVYEYTYGEVLELLDVEDAFDAWVENGADKYYSNGWSFWSLNGNSLYDSAGNNIGINIITSLNGHYLNDDSDVIRFYVEPFGESYNIYYKDYINGANINISSVSTSLPTYYSFGNNPNLDALNDVKLTDAPVGGATFLGWSGDERYFNLTDGFITSVKDGVYGDLTIYGIWGYSIKVLNASGQDVTDSLITSGLHVLNGERYYNFTLPINIYSGVFQAVEANSPSSTLNGYIRFTLNDVYYGSESGLQNEDGDARFVGDVELRVATTITYNFNLGQVEGVTGNSITKVYNFWENYTIEYSNTITRNGYKFIGWNVSVNGIDLANTIERENIISYEFVDGSSAGFEFEKDEDDNIIIKTLIAGSRDGLILTAIWEEEEYTISYRTTDENGYYQILGTQNYTITSQFTFNLKDVVVDGYRFIGWKVFETSGSWQKDTIYLKNSSGNFTNFSVMWGDVILDAQFNLIYTITLTNTSIIDNSSVSNLINLGFVQSEDNYVLEYTVEDDVTLPGVTSASHDFVNWQLTEITSEGFSGWINGGVYNAGTEINGYTGSVVLAAQWNAKQFILTANLNANDATFDEYEGWTVSESLAYKTVSYGSAYGNLPTVSRTGYKLAGWYTLPNGGELVTNATIMTSTSNVTIYAQWEADSFTLTLNATGGTIVENNNWNISNDGSTASKEVTFNTAYGTLPIADYENNTIQIHREGFTFAGWFSLDGSNNNNWGEEVSSSTLLNVAHDVTIYAKWIEYVLTMDANGGQIYESDNWIVLNNGAVATKSVTYKAEYGELPSIDYSTGVKTIDRENYVFMGWFSKNGTTNGDWGEAVTSETLMAQGNVTIYAKWQSQTVVTYYYYYNDNIVLEDNIVLSQNEIVDAKQYFDNNYGEKYFNSNGYNNVTGWSVAEIDETNNWNLNVGDNVDSQMSIVGKYGNVVLKSQITFNIYTISYYEGDTELQDKEQQYTIMDSCEIIDYPTIEYNAWSVKSVTTLDSSNGNWGEIGASILQGSSSSGKYGDVELQVIPGTYTIIFKYNGEQIGEPLSYTFIDSVALIEFTQNGYEGEVNENATWQVGAESEAAWDIFIGQKFEYGHVFQQMFGNVVFEAILIPIPYTIRLTGIEGLTDYTVLTDANFVKDGNDYIQTYDIEDQITLPNINKNYYNFDNWLVTSNSEGSWSQNASFQGESQLNSCWGNVTLTAVWEAIKYRITLQTDEGLIAGYYLNENTNPSFTSNGQYIITYTIESPLFHLPTSDNITKDGFTFRGWTGGAGQGLIKINQINSIDNESYIISIDTNSVGDHTLTAVWAENSYDIILHNNLTAESLKTTVKYSTIQTLSNPFSNQNYVFIGWAISNYSGTKQYNYVEQYQTSSYLDLPFDASDPDSIWGQDIFVDNSKVTKLLKGYDADDPTAVPTEYDIYAIWLPIYTITVQKGADTAYIYNNGTQTELSMFTASQNYYSGYTLPSTLDDEVFNYPISEGYRLFRKGYSINGWTVKVGEVVYSVQGEVENNIPSINQWIQANNFVQNGINLQYLQGDITITPNWKAMRFDVRFKLRDNASYKSSYLNQEFVTEDVLFGTNYLISSATSADANITLIRSINISGYTLVNATPYNTMTGEEFIIPITGVWDYENIRYTKYTIGDAFNKDEGWYVYIDGNYLANLYRIELDLNLPYSTEPTIQDNGDFEIVNKTSSTILLQRYLPLSAETNYQMSSDYLERQNKLYIEDVNGQKKYYIYLLQDQQINANNNTLAEAINLPYFAIDYYEMQYFYMINEINENRMYIMVDELKLDELTPNLSENVKPLDWKYSYCDTNENYVTNQFKFKVIWYRNIINVEVNSIINDLTSPNGYVLINEVEQVIGNLNGHYKNNLIIYMYDNLNSQYDYFIYSFDDDYNGKLEQLFNSNISSIKGNSISIYAGNSFTISVYDQSLDSYLDDFIGYKFKQINYEIQSNSWTQISNLPSNEMQLTINLQDYDTPDNYLTDKDTLILNIEFEKIIYSLGYFVGGEENNDVNEMYGRIYLTYKDNVSENSIHQLQVQVDEHSNIISEMRVNLGSELSRWKYNQQNILDMNFADGVVQINGVTLIVTINANFLRNTVYSNNIYSNNLYQSIGQIKAECSLIEFKINITINNVNNNELEQLENYVLNESIDNAIFNIKNRDDENVYTVTINNQYLITMLLSNDNGKYLYYSFNNTKYAVSRLYIQHNNSSSTNQLITLFDFPATEYDDINLNVDYNLLNRVINYSPNIAVLEENRVLNFIIEVAPLINISFTTTSHENDIFKENRIISANNELIASGNNLQPLNIVVENGEMLAYVNQTIRFMFEGNNKYYEKAILTINYQDSEDSFEILVNSQTSYAITEDCTIDITLIPKTYSLDAKIEYNMQQYDIDDYLQITNSSGTNIFSENGIQIYSRENRVDVFYSGDMISVQYSLNSAIQGDFIVELRANGNLMTYNSATRSYQTYFNGTDVLIIINVEPVSSKVILKTNIEGENIADIKAQINNGSMQNVMLNGEIVNNEFNLSSGDVLNVYVKAKVGFSFDGEYISPTYPIQSGIYQAPISITEDGYIKFTMFDKLDENGLGEYSISKNGAYTLIFDRIPINIQFSYRLYGETLDNPDGSSMLGSGYNYSSNDEIIKQNSEIVLRKGQDSEGYRFNGYSYQAPLNSSTGSPILLEDNFVISDEILDYLSTVEPVNGELPLIIYINYVSQYRFYVELEGVTDKIQYTISDQNGNQLEQNTYYDRSTELDISISSTDTANYVIKRLEIRDIDANGELGNNYVFKLDGITMDQVHNVNNVIYTNNNHVAGFDLIRYLIYDFNIVIELVPEQYSTNITEYKYLTSTDLDNNNMIEAGKGQITSISDIFDLGLEGVHYLVEGSCEYNTEVKVTIIIENPPSDNTEWVSLYKIILNGSEISLPNYSEIIYSGVESKAYTFTYMLTGNNFELDIQYVSVYKLDIVAGSGL